MDPIGVYSTGKVFCLSVLYTAKIKSNKKNNDWVLMQVDLGIKTTRYRSANRSSINNKSIPRLLYNGVIFDCKKYSSYLRHTASMNVKGSISIQRCKKVLSAVLQLIGLSSAGAETCLVWESRDNLYSRLQLNWQHLRLRLSDTRKINQCKHH